jgi:DNA excision repair protein ERCC-1
MTLILAWSEEEAARYLETFKAFDGKDASIIQKKEQTHFADQVADFLGTSKINKTDSGQLLSQFSNLRSLMEASMDELGLVAGMGEVKVRRLHDAFHKPFSSKAAAKRRKTRQEEEEVEDDEGSKEEEFVDDDVEPADGEEDQSATTEKKVDSTD